MSHLKEGVFNLIQNCTQTKKGENILVLNQRGVTDAEVADSIEQTVNALGAVCQTLWSEGLDPKGATLPDNIAKAILSADKVVSNIGINRVVLDEYIRDRGIVFVANTCRTTKSFSHPHARYHWEMVRTIFAYLEELCADTDQWRITSPAGTDITGRVSDGSDIADTFFVQDAQSSRFTRVFPGEVFTPVGSKQASGKIVMEYINMKDHIPWQETALITIENDEIKDIEGGDQAAQLLKTIEKNIQIYGNKAKFLDSWHGGMNPKARVPSSEDLSLVGATSSPALMHFHLGRIKDPISAGNLFGTIELDGRRIIENGKLLVLDDEKILNAKANFGIVE